MHLNSRCVFFLQQEHFILLLLCEWDDNKFLFVKAITIRLTRRHALALGKKLLLASKVTEFAFTIHTTSLAQDRNALQNTANTRFHFVCMFWTK